MDKATFGIYVTFWAISTFSITALEQSVTENLSFANYTLQVIATTFDALLGFWTSIAIVIQALEIYVVHSLADGTTDKWFSMRQGYIEKNFSFQTALFFALQYMRIIRRALEPVQDIYHNQLFSLLFIIPLLLLCLGLFQIYQILSLSKTLRV